MTDVNGRTVGAGGAGPLGDSPTSRSPGASRLAPPTVIVGLDGREHDAAAIALGRTLQAALGGRLVLAHVIPPATPGQAMLESQAILRAQGRELLSLASSRLTQPCECALIEPAPAAKGLARLAAGFQHSLLVLGSSHRGPVGRIVPGGVASQLLACAPCALAVAPVAYPHNTPAPISRIGIAYDGTREADVALAEAADAATTLELPLRLYHAIHEIPGDSAWDQYRRRMHDLASETLERGLKRLPAGTEAQTSVLEGDAATVIGDAAVRDGIDLLYAGSRGYGPLQEALLGGVAGGLLHSVRCPLVIVPRSRRAAARRARVLA